MSKEFLTTLNWSGCDGWYEVVQAQCCHIHWRVKNVSHEHKIKSLFITAEDKKWNWMHLDVGVLNALVDDCDYRLQLDFSRLSSTYCYWLCAWDLSPVTYITTEQRSVGGFFLFVFRYSFGRGVFCRVYVQKCVFCLSSNLILIFFLSKW